MSDSITFDDATPRNVQFGDTYFSKVDGRAETSHVFIDCNNLPERWTDLIEDEPFVIGELGFGTGLNFLETARQWKAGEHKGHLTFLSFEAFPMPSDDLLKSLEPWPDLSDGAKWLADQWPLPDGWNELSFEGVTLKIFIGDALLAVDDMTDTIDAWYLDGFAPSRNPELWEDSLLEKVCDLTRTGGTFATYTSAGWVRRNLQAAGFDVVKFPGFGSKREMIRGHIPAA